MAAITSAEEKSHSAELREVFGQHFAQHFLEPVKRPAGLFQRVFQLFGQLESTSEQDVIRAQSD